MAKETIRHIASNTLEKIDMQNVVIFVFGFLCLMSQAYASPHPGTGSSALVAAEKGLFLSAKGFRLGAENTGWIFSLSKADNEEARLTNPSNSSASLSLKMDTMKADLGLEAYSKRWMKDYSSYGFDILGAKAFQQNGQRGLVIDLVHRLTKKQMRQALFVKNRKAVVLTCLDEKATFQKTLIECNRIIKSFEWANSPAQRTF